MTREEAIRRIKAWNLDADDMEVLSEVIPELKESEDERIRKRIRLCLDECVHSDIIRDYERDECLAYLKKQKESPKSADSIPSDCISDAKCENRWRKVEESLPDNGRLVLAKDSIGNILLARYDGENWEVDVYDNEDYYCRNFITKWCEIPFEVQKEQTNMDLTQQKNEAKL